MAKFIPAEDTPMTMQVGLVGKDGIVLAGDLKTRFFDDYETLGLTPKMLLANRGITLAFSGYEISREVARRIIEDNQLLDLDDQNQAKAVTDIARAVYKEPFPDLVAPARRDSEILIVSKANLSRFYGLEMKNENRIWLMPHLDKAIAGHTANSACYFVQRYYRKECTVAELMMLAAYTILAASKLNPAGIEGLEMITCTTNGIQRVSEDEVGHLITRSEQFDQKMGNSLLRPD